MSNQPRRSAPCPWPPPALTEGEDAAAGEELDSIAKMFDEVRYFGEGDRAFRERLRELFPDDP